MGTPFDTSAPVTLANGLTALRLLIALPTALCMLTGNWFVAAPLFAVAAISDYYDGRIARALQQASSAGALFDHATDAVFVTSVLAAAANLDLVPVTLPLLIPLAFLQYLLDSRVLAGQPLRGDWLGRTNGIAYFALAGGCIGVGAIGLLRPGTLPLTLPVVFAAAWLLTVSTALSMVNRAWHWYRISRLRQSPDRTRPP